MTFKELGLSEDLLKAIAEQGYSQPTPVQSQAIPLVLEGHDMIVGAQTGTGKTASFTLPMLQRLQKRRGAVAALILTPTRELAAQVAESVRVYGKYMQLRSTAVFGGVNINAQIRTFRQGVEILIATPGRLLDHVSQRTVDLSKVEMVVLDEADRMLDMGFINDIKKILALLPKTRQSLLFSATFSREIKELAGSFLKNPRVVEVSRHNTTAEGISQAVYHVDNKRKRELLSHLISTNNWEQVLIFTRTKHGANRLSEQLSQDGITSSAIHGNKSQGARTKALEDFKRGTVRALVATDIAARGLDIAELPHVVNFELPNVAEDYVHRIGRTGRAGQEGAAISLVCIDERDLLRDIERLLKREIPKIAPPGYDPNPSIRAEPIFKGRNSPANHNKLPRTNTGGGRRPPQRTAGGRRQSGV